MLPKSSYTFGIICTFAAAQKRELWTCGYEAAGLHRHSASWNGLDISTYCVNSGSGGRRADTVKDHVWSVGFQSLRGWKYKIPFKPSHLVFIILRNGPCNWTVPERTWHVQFSWKPTSPILGHTGVHWVFARGGSLGDRLGYVNSFCIDWIDFWLLQALAGMQSLDVSVLLRNKSSQRYPASEAFLSVDCFINFLSQLIFWLKRDIRGGYFQSFRRLSDCWMCSIPNRFLALGRICFKNASWPDGTTLTEYA